VREGQQQVLRVTFRGICANVCWLLKYQLGRLGTQYCRTKDPGVRREIKRLNAELARLPASGGLCRGTDARRGPEFGIAS
jgi:hypothetical protein